MSAALAIAASLSARFATICGDPLLAPRLRVMTGDISLMEEGGIEPMMQAAVRFIIEAEQHAAAQKAAADAILAGQKAAAAAAKAARAALLEALEESGAPEVLTSYHAASVKAGRPKVVITDQDALAAAPERFVKVSREWRLAEIAAALADGEALAFATMSNGGASLEIRVRAKKVPA